MSPLMLSKPTAYTKYKAAKYKVAQLLEVLSYARENKPEGFFTPPERMAIHKFRAGWFRTFEKLEDYDLTDGIPEAASAIIEMTEYNEFPDHLERKIQSVAGWIEIKRTDNLI